MTDVPRAFFYHFNKPASAQAKSSKWSVHFQKTCHIVDKVILFGLNTETKNRPTQPRGIVVGRCPASQFCVIDGVAYLGWVPEMDRMLWNIVRRHSTKKRAAAVGGHLATYEDKIRLLQGYEDRAGKTTVRTA